jgi:hypothetical protein
MLALGAAPATAAQIDVGIGGCTLVDAITAANTDTATGGCSAGNGADTIVLLSGSTDSDQYQQHNIRGDWSTYNQQRDYCAGERQHDNEG